MPEGPEIRASSLFVNKVCEGVIFTGNPVKSDVSKNPHVNFSSDQFNISSEWRGKEMALILTCCVNPLQNRKRILFRFGMSGSFRFTPADDMFKHSHLTFYTNTASKMALSFVDPRRFGSWYETEDWGLDRGPDSILQYHEFRDNILQDLHLPIFNKPICEVMLNQKYFNGIGNYLRCEILHRACVPPFVSAREALLHVKHISTNNINDKCNIIELCRDVQLEVAELRESRSKDHWQLPADVFSSWLRCYLNADMHNMVDHNGRTVWYHGNAGPLAPKVRKSRSVKRRDNKVRDEDASMSKSKKTKLEINEENTELVASVDKNGNRTICEKEKKVESKESVKSKKKARHINKAAITTINGTGIMTRNRRKLLGMELKVN